MKSSREAFDLLVQNDLLSVELSKSMKSMVGFRNIAIHDYQRLNIDILEAIINEHIGDFKLYVEELRKPL
ncbi:DUF86 domain-containing protein [Pullulanibacillus sp. KACC 23026]|nr:DUF86 domain-containing protein [Pullulanibacillus sp. KACC 23026]WEG11691.1 DUF86 domain-containing protein [Pullulanibacillus sp. KACC 23026]